MKKGKLLYEGKAKKVFATEDPNLLIQYFKDDATAFDGVKRGTISDKGVVNNKVSGMLFSMLEKKGIPTHFVKFLSDREMLIKKLDIIPVEVIVRNIAAGSLVKNLGVETGRRFKLPILEFCYKSDALHDPPINRYHILALELTTKQRLDKIEEYALKINKILKSFFSKIGIDLVDFKLEFGIHKGKVLLGDEISPDTCRFWDAKTGYVLDKDRFRKDLGNIKEAYQEILKRLSSAKS